MVTSLPPVGRNGFVRICCQERGNKHILRQVRPFPRDLLQAAPGSLSRAHQGAKGCLLLFSLLTFKLVAKLSSYHIASCLSIPYVSHQSMYTISMHDHGNDVCSYRLDQRRCVAVLWSQISLPRCPNLGTFVVISRRTVCGTTAGRS